MRDDKAPGRAATTPGMAGRLELRAGPLIPSVLGTAAFAVPFLHVRQVASWAGQPTWAAWPIAVSIELMAIASGLEIRKRRRLRVGIGWPVGTLLLGVAMSAACNLVAAGPHALPTDGRGQGIHTGPWVQVMALWPVVAFLAVAGMKATRPDPADSHDHAATTGRAVPQVMERPAPGDGEAAPAEWIDAEPRPAVAASAESLRHLPASPPPPAAGGQGKGTTKLQQLAELLAKVPADDPRGPTALARDLARQVGMSEGTARRYIRDLRGPDPTTHPDTQADPDAVSRREEQELFALASGPAVTRPGAAAN